jgi:hypothetical protein
VARFRLRLYEDLANDELRERYAFLLSMRLALFASVDSHSCFSTFSSFSFTWYFMGAEDPPRRFAMDSRGKAEGDGCSHLASK